MTSTKKAYLATVFVWFALAIYTTAKIVEDFDRFDFTVAFICWLGGVASAALLYGAARTIQRHRMESTV